MWNILGSISTFYLCSQKIYFLCEQNYILVTHCPILYVICVLPTFYMVHRYACYHPYLPTSEIIHIF